MQDRLERSEHRLRPPCGLGAGCRSSAHVLDARSLPLLLQRTEVKVRVEQLSYAVGLRLEDVPRDAPEHAVLFFCFCKRSSKNDRSLDSD